MLNGVESGIVTVTPEQLSIMIFLIKDIVSISRNVSIKVNHIWSLYIQESYKGFRKRASCWCFTNKGPKQIPASIFRTLCSFWKNILDKKIVDKNPVMAWALSSNGY